jgi:hypothetical protein
VRNCAPQKWPCRDRASPGGASRFAGDGREVLRAAGILALTWPRATRSASVARECLEVAAVSPAGTWSVSAWRANDAAGLSLSPGRGTVSATSPHVSPDVSRETIAGRIELLLLIGDTLSVRFTWRFVAVNDVRLPPLRHERPDQIAGHSAEPLRQTRTAPEQPFPRTVYSRRGAAGKRDDPLNQRSHATFHLKRQHDGVTRTIAAFAAAGSWNGLRSQGRAPSVRLSRTRGAPFHVKLVGSTRILENSGQTESRRGDPPTIACRGRPSTGSANQFPATKDPRSSTGRHSRVRRNRQAVRPGST